MNVNTIPEPARFDSLIEVPFGSINVAYTAIGSPLTHQWRIIDIVNTTNQAMYISFNGVANNIYVPAGGFRVYDLFANNLREPIGTQIFLKYEAAPASGKVVVMGVYSAVP